MTDRQNDILILGGGLTGLSAGYALARAGRSVSVFERDAAVGGISKTIVHDGYRFDLGGHRFFTKDPEIDSFVKDLLGEELVSVPRLSKILLRRRYFDYPLKPFNAVFGFGIPTTLRILADYAQERMKAFAPRPEPVSLEEWVVARFGRALYDIYFKVYSEKVWGIPCDRISAAWVDQRISGLSLAAAVKNAFFRLNGRAIPTLVDRFLYPALGIGRMSDRLAEEIEAAGGAVVTQASVERINHAGARISSLSVRRGGNSGTIAGSEFVSSIPLTNLVRMLTPPPPTEVLEAAANLRFRDLVVAAVMIDRERVTDLTWLYVPEPDVPFGRIHEPTNWSAKMAPGGKTLLVMEYFSFRGDRIWIMSDADLSELTVSNLERLGFIGRREVLGSVVVRVPRAYPLFEVGHERSCETILEYLSRFTNLHVAGRAGMFKYYNMDHAIESGFSSARRILEKNSAAVHADAAEFSATGSGTCAAR